MTYDGGARILVVDDEPQLVEIQKAMLEQNGYSISETTDSTEALKLFLEPQLVEEAWAYFNDVQSQEQDYTSFITADDPPPKGKQAETADERKIAAGLGLFDIKDFKALWRIRRSEFWLGATTVAAVRAAATAAASLRRAAPRRGLGSGAFP